MLIDQKFPDRKEIGLACVGDWHLGSMNCNEKAVDAWIKEIKEKKHYVFMMGDLCENAIVSSVGSVFEQTLTPQEQLHLAIEKLRPIKDYIIGGVSGNHGARTVRTAGIDPDAIISFELGVPHYGHLAAGRIRVGHAHWTIIAHHGAGGGVLQGNKLNMIKKLANIYPMADLYLAGHTHSDVSGSDRVFDVVVGSRVVERMQTRHFSGTGSLLNYHGSYAEAKLMPPAQLSQPVHYMGDRVHVSVKPDAPEQYIKPYRREVRYF